MEELSDEDSESEEVQAKNILQQVNPNESMAVTGYDSFMCDREWIAIWNCDIYFGAIVYHMKRCGGPRIMGNCWVRGVGWLIG